MLARGCGNALVGLHGIVNMRCRGTPKVCAQWMWAKLGGFAIIASAMNGVPVSGSGSIQDRQHPLSIAAIIFRFFEISPLSMVFISGIMLGLLTM